MMKIISLAGKLGIVLLAAVLFAVPRADAGFSINLDPDC